jgi:serine carboxypeptidase-like clade 1
MGQLWVDEADPTKLVLNPSSWTNISSMIFIEAPACVGYSYADDIAGCTHDDTTQAVDNYQALLTFFRGFPEYANNSFFITGESYAGIYVPTLAQQVVLGNAAGNPRVNLQGIAVGNGCLGLDIGVCAFDYRNELNTNMPYFIGHGLISPVTFAAVQKDCDPAAAGPSDACQADFDAARKFGAPPAPIHQARALNGAPTNARPNSQP